MKPHSSKKGRTSMNPRERLVHHVQELERLEKLKQEAAELLREAFEDAKAQGYDPTTLKVVLKLRKMTPDQRRERRALEAIYMAALGMLEGDSLPDAARRRLDEESRGSRPPDTPSEPDAGAAERGAESDDATPPRQDPQPTLPLKEPAEARQEGADAAAAGKRIYENPYAAGDPCRAAWDEGWCARQKSHGMETPSAYQRRSTKPPDKPDKDEKPDKDDAGAGERGAA